MVVGWVVFQRHLSDGIGVEVLVTKDKPPYSNDHHQVFFGFCQRGFDNYHKHPRPEFPIYPSYAEYRGVLQGSKQGINIENWLKQPGDQGLGLSDCFGPHTFVPQEIKSDLIGLNLKMSLSELIRAYLNNNSECPFRQGSRSQRGLGITKCKAEVLLSQTGVGAGACNLLANSAISFSYVEPDTFATKRFSGLYLGEMISGPPGKLKDGLDRYLRPLSVRPTLETDGRANFALCFTHSGRHQIFTF